MISRQKLGTIAKVEKARTNINNLQAVELINDKRKAGWTYQRIADGLSYLESQTSKGNEFKAITARELLERFETW